MRSTRCYRPTCSHRGQRGCTVLLFALALTMVTGLLFGIAPAWHAAKTDLNEVLMQATRASSGLRPRLRNGLAAAELALATVLLIGAGLLAQSLLRLQQVNLGFQSDHLLTFQLALPANGYTADQRATFYRNLLDSLQRRSRCARRCGLERHSVRQRCLHDDADRDDRTVAVASGYRGADRLARCEPRIFRGDEAFHCCAAASSLTPTRRDGAAGRHRQSGDGTAVLGRHRSDRPHPPSPGRSRTAIHRDWSRR